MGWQSKSPRLQKRRHVRADLPAHVVGAHFVLEWLKELWSEVIQNSEFEYGELSSGTELTI